MHLFTITFSSAFAKARTPDIFFKLILILYLSHAHTKLDGLVKVVFPQKDRGPLIEPLSSLCHFYVLRMDRCKTVPQFHAILYYEERESSKGLTYQQ